MRFTLSSSALSSRLSILSKVINSKNALPILDIRDFPADHSDLVALLRCRQRYVHSEYTLSYRRSCADYRKLTAEESARQGIEILDSACKAHDLPAHPFVDVFVRIHKHILNVDPFVPSNKKVAGAARQFIQYAVDAVRWIS